MSDKIIFYLGGGGMLGLFGAGVLTKVQELDIYNKVEAIYACSSGIFNGSYFLTRQMEMGSSIYYDDLTHGFIETKNVLYGTLQRMQNGYVKPIDFDKIVNVMNLDRLIDVAKNDKALNISTLKSQSIPLYVKLLNTNTLEIEYKDIRKNNPLHLLKVGTSAVPYYFPSQDNGKYIDAAIKEPLGLEYLLERHPDSKVIAIFNLSTKRNVWHYLKNVIEGLIANSMYRGTFSKCFMQRESSIRKNLKIAEENERVLLISPSHNSVESWTTDETTLKQFYQDGKDEVASIVEFLKK